MESILCGNVLLNEGEGNLPESSVVNVSQFFTVDKRLLTESVGRLSQEKIKLIIQGIKIETILYEYIYRTRTPEEIGQIYPTLTLEPTFRRLANGDEKAEKAVQAH